MKPVAPMDTQLASERHMIIHGTLRQVSKDEVEPSPGRGELSRHRRLTGPTG